MVKVKNLLNGLIYLWLWNCSIFTGYLMFVPLCFLQILTPKLYRKILDIVVTYWQYYVTTLLVRNHCEVHVTGDPIHSDEVALVISNHRTRVDWNFLWPVMYHAVEGKNKWWYSTKFVLKNSIRNIPGAGWVMQLAMYIFINRNWEEDKARLDDYIEYVKEMGYKHILVLFPEGTDLTPTTKQSSDRFAVANGLPKYSHVLHPRSTGFVYLVDEMRKKNCLDAVYDVTLIYPDECPQNEPELFFDGKFPKKVIAHIVRYPVSTLPDSKEHLKEFLKKRWLEKENTIEELNRTGHLLHYGRVLNKNKYLTLRWAYFTQGVWLAATSMIIVFLYWKVFFYLVILHTVALYVIPLFTKSSVFQMRRTLLRLIIGRTTTYRMD